VNSIYFDIWSEDYVTDAVSLGVHKFKGKNH